MLGPNECTFPAEPLIFQCVTWALGPWEDPVCDRRQDTGLQPLAVVGTLTLVFPIW